MPTDYFDERVAERYDEAMSELAQPAVVEPVFDFLAALAGERGARARHRHRPHRAAPGATRSSCTASTCVAG
jgi:hypothetical protein